MSLVAFTLIRYDPDRRWIVLSKDRMTVDLPVDAAFHDWARDRFPGDSIEARTDDFVPPGVS